MEKRAFLIAVSVVATFAVAASLVATVVLARASSYALKGLVLDKSTADKWFELRVTHQTKGKTDLRGDRLIVRVLSTTGAYNKSNASQTTSSWLSKLQNSDSVSVAGEYKSTDGTIWADRVVNRTR
ncbi:MAG: hypothetical protein Q8R32_03220 [bacterium]|nr:hypothetical protein [bacterium]